MHILYYLSAHGYGHGVRACSICNHLPSTIKLTFKTTLPPSFFEEELSRPFEYYNDRYDCGCIQTDGVTVDVYKTLHTYIEIAKSNEALLSKEVQWCKRNKVSIIISDIVPFAFEVAKVSNIPSIGISNFSWDDIYKPYVQDNPFFEKHHNKIKKQYMMADLLLALWPENKMTSFKNKRKIPLLNRQGKNCIKEIQSKYTIPKNKKIGLIYIGNFGLNVVNWKKLETFKDWEFLGIYPLSPTINNFHLVDKSDFPYNDIIASVDLIISKIGYGIFSECLSNGIPLLYLPRFNFAEYPVLEQAIKEWGHGYVLSQKDFLNCDWGNLLKRVKISPHPKKIISKGNKRCADIIVNNINSII